MIYDSTKPIKSAENTSTVASSFRGRRIKSFLIFEVQGHTKQRADIVEIATFVIINHLSRDLLGEIQKLLTH